MTEVKKKRAYAKKAATTVTPQTAGATDTRVVTYAGREIEVRQPTPEQMIRWGQSAKAFESEGVDTDFDMLNENLNRLWGVILSVVTRESDREWLCAGRDSGDVSILTAHSIVTDASNAFGNRETRRASLKKV
jgi:hypothetical protein